MSHEAYYLVISLLEMIWILDPSACTAHNQNRGMFASTSPSLKCPSLVPLKIKKIKIWEKGNFLIFFSFTDFNIIYVREVRPLINVLFSASSNSFTQAYFPRFIFPKDLESTFVFLVQLPPLFPSAVSYKSEVLSLQSTSPSFHQEPSKKR